MIIDVKVKTGSGKFRIEQEDHKITIFTKSQPENGKANREIVQNLSKMYKKPVKIISGQKSSRKRILIE